MFNLYLVFVIVILHVVNGNLTRQDAESKQKKLQIGIKRRSGSCLIKSKRGDFLHTHYKGILESGDEFDNSYVRGQTLTFTLGSGQVIEGLDQGLMGMCIGEERKLVIPPKLAYGILGAPPVISANAVLTFYVELVDIERRNEL